MASIIPPNATKLVKFTDQVAGHDRLLRFSTHDLMVIKPATRKEIDFYEEAQQRPDFECWIPKCFGNLHMATDSELAMLREQHINDAELSQTLLKASSATDADTPLQDHRPIDSQGRSLDENLCLENVLHGFTRPCVLDLKLGTRLYDDDATPEKREKMQKNAKGTTSEELGIRISGMKVYNTIDRAWAIYDKQFGRSRTADTILDGLLSFFFPTSSYAKANDPVIVNDEEQDKAIGGGSSNSDVSNRKRISGTKMNWIMENLLDDIGSIREYVEEHPELEMYCASLLMVFEGDKDAADTTWKTMLQKDRQEKTRTPEEGENGQGEEEEEEEEEEPKLCDVRLIDFAHSRWDANRQSQDEGLLKGLDSIMTLLEKCMEKQSNENL
ncbi:arginine metabolism regulation protein iii [Lichtheimia corymbifera JMRC:FSU:9682]|uniref:Kinase n=1 Tax=Lichtheimia corymbifera JMRC:FSU:9682 TaxID=1263082 RepID=A0A068RP39_9FUNG|nr:arginine metabolism regulation protein iii [Lichtheimia corymbifera JMRC:FSU:9682]